MRDSPGPPDVVVFVALLLSPARVLDPHLTADCPSPQVLVTQGWLSQACHGEGGDIAGLEDSVEASSKGPPDSSECLPQSCPLALSF